MSRKLKDLAVVIAIVIVVSSLAFVALLYGIEKVEIVECLKLQRYAEQFQSFHLTVQESEMCLRHAIEIDAPVQ